MAVKLDITPAASFSTDDTYITPSLPLDLSSSNLNFSDNFTLLDLNSVSNFLKYISLTGWQMSATAGELHDFLIDGTSYLQISETEITPAVPFANIKTTGLIQGSRESKASASTLTAPTANLIHISGTTTINLMPITNIAFGTIVTMRFGSTVTINHNNNGAGGSGSFYLQGSANTSFPAGSRVMFQLMELGSNAWVQIAARVTDS